MSTKGRWIAAAVLMSLAWNTQAAIVHVQLRADQAYAVYVGPWQLLDVPDVSDNGPRAPGPVREGQAGFFEFDLSVDHQNPAVRFDSTSHLFGHLTVDEPGLMFGGSGATTRTFIDWDIFSGRSQRFVYLDIVRGVPEPGTWALLLSGLAIVGLIARKALP